MNSKGIKIASSDHFDLQRRIVSHMTATSWQNIPHISYLYEPDITEFYEEYIKLGKEWSEAGNKITFNTLLLKTVTQGLQNAPELNAHLEFNYKKAEGVLHRMADINIAVPWTLSDGKMITPIIRNIENMTLEEISGAIANLSRKIENTNINEMLYQAVRADTIDELKKFKLSVLKRIVASKISKHRITGLKGKDRREYYRIDESNRLTEKDLMCATVTVSNIGSLYKEQKGFLCLLEIIPPQVFAIGIGSIQEKPGVYVSQNGTKEIGIRMMLPMCLAFDHRAIDFSSIVPFMKRLDEIFSDPVVITRW
jgi:pyruvate dehydrogenase E2 component (dihydrolipoamide acetyltransferase)